MSKLVRLGDHRPHESAVLTDYDASLNIIVAHLNRLAEAARMQGAPAPTSPRFVRRVIAARAARRQFFAADLFADPAWDILLELYALHCEQQRTSVSKLCIAVAVPATTALRWIDKLQSEGLLDRAADPLDARRIWVAISPKGMDAMESYLQELTPGSEPL